MRRLTVYALISCFLVATAASAEPPAPAGSTPGIRASMARVKFSGDRDRSTASSHAARTHTNSPAQRATAAVAIGFLGMLAGAWVGANLQPDCKCDDPGLTGAMIGMPVGAVLGGIVGWRLSR